MKVVVYEVIFNELHDMIQGEIFSKQLDICDPEFQGDAQLDKVMLRVGS